MYTYWIEMKRYVSKCKSEKNLGGVWNYGPQKRSVYLRAGPHGSHTSRTTHSLHRPQVRMACRGEMKHVKRTRTGNP